MPFHVTDFGTNQKLECDFLLAIIQQLERTIYVARFPSYGRLLIKF